MKAIVWRFAQLFRGRPIRYDYAEAHRPSNNRDLPIEAAMIAPRSVPNG